MKLSDASGILATLDYRVYDLKELIDIGKSVNNLKQTTLDSIQLPLPYSDDDGNLYKLDSLKVNIKYQRKMRLKKVLDKLKSHGGFNKEAAGHIDVAIRPNGDIFIWDGFRRAFMAGIAGLENIPVSIYKHPLNRTDKQCEEYESLMFKIRNADQETMKPEEIFRSMVVYRDPDALNFLDFLIECRVDVEGLNPGNKELGGMVQVQDAWKNGKIKEINLINSSRIIRKTWSNDVTISGYLLCGLGKFLDVNDEVNRPYDLEEIQDLFFKYVNVNPPKKQESLTSRRLNKSPSQSIAYFIAKYVMDLDETRLKEYTSLLNLDDEEVEMLDGQ